MSDLTIPLTPAPLTAAQAEAMSQRQFKKHHVAIILLHWFNATVWLLELATGGALISSPYFRLAPGWYIDMLTAMFGSRANLLHVHIAIGVTWTVVFLVYGLFGFRTYLQMEVLQREVGLDRDDWLWLKVRLANMLHRARDPLPPQGIYNAGQKLFAALIYAMIPIIMVTGVIMAFHLAGTAVVQWALVAHFAAVGLVVSGLIIHVYMGAVFPEEKPAFFSMITGTVNELFAYRHHFKWWREVKMQERAWEREWADPPRGPAEPAFADIAAPPAASPSEAAAMPASGWIRLALRQPAYWPPYVAGTGLGLTLLAAFLVMGQGLGASGGFTRYLVSVIAAVAPHYAAGHPYWSNYYQPGQSPLLDFLVFELIGAAIGGFVSGWLSGRLRISVDKGPRISARTRYALALGGGILTGLGARLARGCTSGLALSGGAVLSAGAFIFMMAVFAAGFAGAYFMRRYWL
ncbi:MAG TPA: cytochrome b/b6 domain-containing protein [Bryobacteraceae bacterium]|nr:cytochrome b/b6 domain-containing protein [Bryobacteraceae bacterium]